MGALHYTAFVFLIMLIITAIIGQITAWAERSFDIETQIIEEARGRPSNAYLFIASAFFIIVFAIEALALVIYLLELAGWL